MGLEDTAVAFGAAVGTLDMVVRRQERWAGAWRQRMALSAAGVSAQREGRVEDEAALRDAVFLTRPGDDVGPAGRILLGWRGLASRPVDSLLTKPGIANALDEFEIRGDGEAVIDLARDLRQLAGAGSVLEMLAGTFTSAQRYGFGPTFGSWLADAMLAQKLGWSFSLPLFGAGFAARGARHSPKKEASFGREGHTEGVGTSVREHLVAHSRAALRSVDLSTELGRRAQRLIAVAPKLRAKGSDAVVEKLLSDDAIVASQPIRGMSDRGLRRLFDRLVDLGAVRELSGRSTFRLYGL